MDPRAARLTTIEQCEALERNALAGGNADLAANARKRAIQINAGTHGQVSDVEAECLQAIYAYERARSQGKGMKFRANRTWQMIKRRGVVPAVEHIVTKPGSTMGFDTLIQVGLADYAFEAVVLRHPGFFSQKAVEISRRRLPAP